jgi:hypothetical protein
VFPVADLSLGAGRPYSLVTTIVHRGPGQCKLAQLDLHMTSGNIRLRFHDRQSLAHFCLALDDLAREALLPNPAAYRAVRTQVYTDHDRRSGAVAEQRLISDLFATSF